jgi:hypothetical protein
MLVSKGAISLDTHACKANVRAPCLVYNMQIRSKQGIVVPNCLNVSKAKEVLTAEPELANIINSCLRVNAADRPSAEQLVQASEF